MAGPNHPIAARMPPLGRWRAPDTPVLTPALWAAFLALLAVGMALALYRYPPPSAALVLAGGLGFTGVVLFALTRYEAAVALGFLLLGVVYVEPAPPDLVFAAVIAIATVTGRFDISRVPFVVSGLIATLIALTLLSSIEAVDPARAGFFASITLYLCVFGLWFTAYLDSFKRARWAVIGYTAGAVASAALALGAILLPIPGQELLTFHGVRAQALFKDPNVFGPFLVPPALIMLQELVEPRLFRLRAVSKLLIMLVLVLGVLFTFSRAAWLNLAIGAVVLGAVLALRRGGSRRVAGLLAIGLVGGAVVASTLAITGSVDFLNERAQFQAYDAERFGAQEEGIALAEERPFGAGPGQIEVLLPVASHNSYVRVLAEQGVLGLAVFLSLTLTTLLLAARNAALGRHTYGIGSAALLGAWCGILTNSLFVDTIHWRHLWVVAAMIWAGALAGRASTSRRLART